MKVLLLVCSVYTVYLLVGGAVFMYLETPLDVIEPFPSSPQNYMISGNIYTNDHDLFRRAVLSLVQNMTKEERFHLLEYTNEAKNPWTYYNAVFFSLTLVTTIGYGNVAPGTTFGQLFCIFYAMLGIPLNIVVLKIIGSHFSVKFEKIITIPKWNSSPVYKIACCTVQFFIPWFVVFLILPSVVFMYTESWTFLEGVYFCFITLATVGFGDYVAGNINNKYAILYKTAVLLWLIFGLAYIAMVLNFIARLLMVRFFDAIERRMSKNFQHTLKKLEKAMEALSVELCSYQDKVERRRRRSSALYMPGPSQLPDIAEDDSEDEQIKKMKVMIDNVTAVARKSIISMDKRTRSPETPAKATREEDGETDADDEDEGNQFSFLRDI